MIEIKKGTLAERIIKNVQDCYPITIKELNKKLGVSIRTLKAELLKLQAKNLIQLESLPDKTFIRLIRTDILFVGRRKQYKFIKKTKLKQKKETTLDDDIMYR